MQHEVEVEKPRLTYAQFLASQKAAPGTVAALIERFIAEMDLPGMKKLGETHAYSLRAVSRRSIGPKIAATLKRPDFIAYARERRQWVKPATVNQDITYLSGVLKYASSAWEDCEAVGDAVAQLEAAKPFLQKHNLIGKAMPRKRVATDEEVVMLLDYYAAHPGRKLRMPDFIAAGLSTTRRRGELCRMMHGDIDWNRKDEHGNPTPMYMIRDLKHPTKKDGNHKWFPLFPEFAEIIKSQPRKDPNDPEERVFPFIPECVSQSFITAKKAIAKAAGNQAILTLRLHDSRRRAITMWLAKLKSPHKVKLISGHETTHILERVYDATKPDTLHADMRAT
jgi:integrase